MITRRDISIAAVAVFATAAAARWAWSSSPPAVMHSATFDWNGFKAEATKSGFRRECLDAHTATLDRLEVHATTLNPGQSPHPAHMHPEEEVIIVKEGVLESAQNDKINRVEAGGMIFQASNELHGLKNVGTKPAVYYVIKFFPPGMGKEGKNGPGR
jgi:XRE family transcriptional regulator, regulator of sulfur utilization